MYTRVVLVKLTDEEIEALPFSDTARAIGGIYVPMDFYDSAEEQAILEAELELLREEFRKTVGDRPLRTPVFDDTLH